MFLPLLCYIGIRLMNQVNFAMSQVTAHVSNSFHCLSISAIVNHKTLHQENWFLVRENSVDPSATKIPSAPFR